VRKSVRLLERAVRSHSPRAAFFRFALVGMTIAVTGRLSPHA
jgi:hypothetical protein